MSQMIQPGGPWDAAGTKCNSGATELAQLAAQNGGQVPSLVDIQVIVGKDSVNFGSSTTANVYQVSLDGSTGALLWGGDVGYGQTKTLQGVAIDPNGGGIALFVPGVFGGVYCNVTASLQVVPSGKPMQAQGGIQTQSIGDQVGAAGNAAVQAALDAGKKALEEHATEMFDTSLIVGAVFFLVIVGMIMVYSKPSLPAQVGASAADEFQRRRALPEGA